MSELLALFTRASKLVRAAADEAMRRHGVRLGQNLVLQVLWEHDGLTPGELAQRLHVSTPATVTAATRMEAAGLLTRERDPKDARLVRLYLTDRARGVRGAIEEERRKLEQRVLATLTEAEQRHVTSALAKVINEFSDTSLEGADDDAG